MKNFLLFLLGILINALGLFVVAPLYIAGISAFLWMPFFIGYTIEQKVTMLVFGIIISISTASIARAVTYYVYGMITN